MNGRSLLAGFDPGPEIRRSVRGHERHVPRLVSLARDLERFAGLGPRARRAALDARLGALRESLWRSPFYCSHLRARGLSPNDLHSVGDLAHFPLLEREALRDSLEPLAVLAPGRERGRLFVERSSGSTGRPLAVLKEDYDSVHMWAVVRFWLHRLGRRLPPRPRVVLLCTLPHGVEYETELPALGHGRLARISIVRPLAWERLCARRPQLLFTDPAGLHWLAGQPRLDRAPCLVASSAMHLAPQVRQAAGRVLGAPIVNYYSTSETGPIAWECERRPGAFHVLLPDVWVESPEGDLLVTRLRESVLPLVRYRVGDRGRVSEGTCACGHSGLTLIGLSGRRACRFLTPAGAHVDAWQLAWAFQHHPLDGFRVVQREVDDFLLETASRESAAVAKVEARLRASLVALGWPEPRIAHRRVARAALAAAKPEPFACRLPDPGRFLDGTWARRREGGRVRDDERTLHEQER